MSFWQMNPGETLDLGVSFDGELDSGASLTGTPTISIWEKTGAGSGDYTEKTTDFTISNEQVNAGAVEDEKGRTIATGRAALFRLTASTTQGNYEVRVESDADDGTHPAITRDLRIDGPGAP